MDSGLELRLKKIHPGLPTYEFDLFSGSTRLGLIQIRMKPGHGKNVPSEMANHIYYEIDPEFRRKGYGKEMLRLALIEAMKLGLTEVIITCNKSNIASKKIIEANGGQFIEERPLIDNSEILMKYRIDLK